MNKPASIKYWNRYSNREEKEIIYGDKFIRALYETKKGQELSKVLASPIFSKLYGFYQSSPLSKKKSSPFIINFNIQMEEFEKGPFKSFNDFFIRRFLPGARTFVESKKLPAFAEGRYLGFTSVEKEQLLPIKGKFLMPELLLGNKELSKNFLGGPLLIARLCPTDYHRFHFPDEGEALDSFSVDGNLQSVNPIALKYRPDIFSKNKRHVTILKTKNFGTLAYVEVGAMMVGKIVQSYVEKSFKRGDEKGYFLFGGSTVILLGEKGSWKPSPDILANSSSGLETFIRLGDEVAVG